MKYNPMNSHRIARIALAVILATILILAFTAYTDRADANGVTTAQIRMMDGSLVEGVADDVYKYRNSAGTIDVEIDGITYTTHFSNVVLMVR